jgi:hypothetical protein
MSPEARYHTSMLQKWFGPDRGTPWVIAGSAAIILLGSYLVYVNRDGKSTSAVAIPATVETPVPMTPVSPAPPAPAKPSSE